MEMAEEDERMGMGKEDERIAAQEVVDQEGTEREEEANQDVLLRMRILIWSWMGLQLLQHVHL
jgi:hypothetical protein